MRRFVLYCLVTGTLLPAVPNIAHAGSAGRRNTAIAATALAVGAWSNGTGKAGRRNTAILTTAGAGLAWSRYASKKRDEKRRPRRVAVAGWRANSDERYCKWDRGCKRGHFIGKGHWKHCGHGHCRHHHHDDD